VGLADDHTAEPDPSMPRVAIVSGGLASSSTTVRRWNTAGGVRHHIVDPRTGTSADTPWRTVTVAAASCFDANTASTAAVVLGDRAPSWLARLGLPARLVASDGRVTCVAGWPEDEA
jgi:FAD:protein FMN transferase